MAAVVAVALVVVAATGLFLRSRGSSVPSAPTFADTAAAVHQYCPSWTGNTLTQTSSYQWDDGQPDNNGTGPPDQRTVVNFPFVMGVLNTGNQGSVVNEYVYEVDNNSAVAVGVFYYNGWYNHQDVFRSVIPSCPFDSTADSTDTLAVPPPTANFPITGINIKNQ